VADTSVDILIVGAGFAGLGMAIALRKAGFESFLLIEKGDDVGGTWRENRYPGCACDIPSHLYSFSFDLKPDWSRMYAPQPEIWEYLRECAKRYGVLGRVRFHTALREAVWDAARGLWNVTTQDGERIHTRVLISGMGALHVPRYPDLPGLERFRGPAFHSAAWDAGVALEGRNIAVIGTGASAIQFVPQIAPRAGRIYLYQRTPPWILPKADFPIAGRWQEHFARVPGLMRLYRAWLFWNLEIRVAGFLGNRWLERQGERLARRHLDRQVADPQLRAALTPNYAFGCKRVLISSDFYAAIQLPNVELLTGLVAEVREHSFVTADGVKRPVDVLIYATGFRATDLLHGVRIVGRGGIDFQQAWRASRSALFGITMSGFPNFFMLLGPNTGLGHNSVVLMIEAQIRYVMSCLKLMERRGCRSMDLRLESQRRFGDFLRRRLATTVWQTGGCRSWYQDAETGENPTIWPGSVVAYRRRTQRVAAADYDWSSVGQEQMFVG
jgi:cation diffusion facilitator CzcD-associated flavoprotein CzcO